MAMYGNDMYGFTSGRAPLAPQNGNMPSTGFNRLTNPDGSMNWGGALSDIGTGAGLYAQGNAQNNSASLAQQYAKATGQLNPFGVSTDGGINAGMHNGNINIGYGQFDPSYTRLAGATGNAAGTAGDIQAPFGLSGALNGAFGQAAGGLGGFNAGGAGFAANNAFLGAGSAAARAGMPQQDMMQNYMQQLQQLQAPGIQHQMDQLQGTLFGNGQTGSSSGGYLAQQFGQGLASQNTQNALAASHLGLQGQQVAAGTAGTLGGLGNSLLNSAFSNFGGSAGLPAGLQGQYMQNAGAGIGAAGQLTNQGLGLYNAGLQTSLGQNQASSRAGYLSTQNANSMNQQSPFGQLLAGAFGSQGGAQALQRLFGGNGTAGLLSKIPGLGNLFGGGNNGFVNPGFDTMGGSTQNPNATGDMGPGFSPADYGVNAGYGGQGTDPNAGNSIYDTSGMYGGGDTGFTGASGQAATPSGSVDPAVSQGYASNNPFYGPGGGASAPAVGAGASSLTSPGSLFKDLGNVSGIYSGLQKGGITGDLGAAANAGALANRVGVFGGTPNSTVGAGLGDLGGALSIYNGLKSGSPMGYANAGIGAAQLSSSLASQFGAAANAGSTAAAGGAASGATGALAGAGVTALAMAPAIAGSRSSGTVLNSDYWNRLGTSLSSGKSGNATYDQYTSPSYQKGIAQQDLYHMLTTVGPSMSGQWHIPDSVMSQAKSLGMVDANGKVNRNWTMDPSLMTLTAPLGGPSRGGGGRKF